MIREIKCVRCGKTKEIDYKSQQDFVDAGFDFAWDISNGLSSIPICDDCGVEAKKHVHALEDIFKLEIDYMNLSRFSKIKNK